MHILLVADGRSPNAQKWIQTLKALDHKVTLVSTYPCDFIEGVDALVIMPIAFARAAGSQVGKKGSGRMGLVARFRPPFPGGALQTRASHPSASWQEVCRIGQADQTRYCSCFTGSL